MQCATESILLYEIRFTCSASNAYISLNYYYKRVECRRCVVCKGQTLWHGIAVDLIEIHIDGNKLMIACSTSVANLLDENQNKNVIIGDRSQLHIHLVYASVYSFLHDIVCSMWVFFCVFFFFRLNPFSRLTLDNLGVDYELRQPSVTQPNQYCFR